MTGEPLVRLAIVLHPSLEAGEGANVASVLAGGIRCAGFTDPITDSSGVRHVAVIGNVVVLRAKTGGQLSTLLAAAAAEALDAVVFTRRGQELSNQYEVYRRDVIAGEADGLGVMGVAVFGADEVVRRLTRSCSLFR